LETTGGAADTGAADNNRAIATNIVSLVIVVFLLGQRQRAPQGRVPSQFSDVLRRVAERDQRFPARQYDRIKKTAGSTTQAYVTRRVN
jgi:hypothetical protein